MAEAEEENGVKMVTGTELVELDSLQKYAQNPKNHSQEQIETIKESILRFGWDQDIVVDGDGVIIKGHGRYEAAKQLGLQRVPVKWRDGLSPDEVRSARIIDNKANLDSGFNYDLLAMEVDELMDKYTSKEVATMTGFSNKDIDDFIQRNGGSIDDLTMGDEWESETADDGESDAGDGSGGSPENSARGERRVLYDEDGQEVEVHDHGDGNVTVDHDVTCPECGAEFSPADSEADD